MAQRIWWLVGNAWDLGLNGVRGVEPDDPKVFQWINEMNEIAYPIFTDAETVIHGHAESVVRAISGKVRIEEVKPSILAMFIHQRPGALFTLNPRFYDIYDPVPGVDLLAALGEAGFDCL